MSNRIVVRSNEDFFQPVVITNGLPGWNLDDYAIEMHVKTSVEDPNILVRGSIATGELSIVDATAGEIEVFLSRQVLQDTLGLGSFVFDFQLVETITGFAESTPLVELQVIQGVTYQSAP